MKTWLIILTLVLTGCVSTGVVLMEKDKYMVAKRSAQAGRGPAYGAQADVYLEANEFCGKQNKNVETVKLIMTDTEPGRPGSASLEFRCVSDSVPK
jgi:hypothetical protein